MRASSNDLSRGKPESMPIRPSGDSGDLEARRSGMAPGGGDREPPDDQVVVDSSG
jgi:hypothetical protein